MATNSWQIELATSPLVSAHYVGNRNNGHELILSEKPLDTDDHRMNELLFTYFLGAFREPEMNHFTFSNDDFKLNPLYQFACSVFDNKGDFHLQSVNIARHLFDVSNHPQIKSGDLFVAYIDGVIFNNKECKAIGIFKSETKESYLKVNLEDGGFALTYEEDAINITKLDKGCLIFYTEKDEGYKVIVIDQTNRTDAAYWKDEFLQLKIRNDNFNKTSTTLGVCKDFITNKIDEDFEISKADKIDLLNKSLKYFKEKESFDLNEFSEEVIGNPKAIESFKNFSRQYNDEFDAELDQPFDISGAAVKKQAKVFKSILKLDKNFHIYIHGNKDLIEKGFDEGKSMNYYKVFFREEQ